VVKKGGGEKKVFFCVGGGGGGGGIIAPIILNLCDLGVVSSQLHASVALHPGKHRPYPLIRRLAATCPVELISLIKLLELQISLI